MIEVVHMECPFVRVKSPFRKQNGGSHPVDPLRLSAQRSGWRLVTVASLRPCHRSRKMGSERSSSRRRGVENQPAPATPPCTLHPPPVEGLALTARDPNRPRSSVRSRARPE